MRAPLCSCSGKQDFERLFGSRSQPFFLKSRNRRSRGPATLQSQLNNRAPATAHMMALLTNQAAPEYRRTTSSDANRDALHPCFIQSTSLQPVETSANTSRRASPCLSFTIGSRLFLLDLRIVSASWRLEVLGAVTTSVVITCAEREDHRSEAWTARKVRTQRRLGGLQ